MGQDKTDFTMSTEQTSIHDFDFQLICEYYAGIERQGPGSPEATLKALSFVEAFGEEAHIADIGCGTGGQTMVLAQHCPAHIRGLDLFPEFINLFNKNAARLQLEDRVQGMVGNMEQLPFREEELDMIWSEGAIYNIGFERGMLEWRPFLKPGGWIVVSEASWFTSRRPKEIEAFWEDAYPGIDTIPANLARMQDAGYVPVASFILPEECWTEHFYAPQVKLQEDFLKKYAGNSTAEAFIENQRAETRLYMKYKQHYGYAFYIGRKL
jgi:SAM-dependent methyltransferase